MGPIYCHGVLMSMDYVVFFPLIKVSRVAGCVSGWLEM